MSTRTERAGVPPVPRRRRRILALAVWVLGATPLVAGDRTVVLQDAEALIASGQLAGVRWGTKPDVGAYYMGFASEELAGRDSVQARVLIQQQVMKSFLEARQGTSLSFKDEYGLISTETDRDGIRQTTAVEEVTSHARAKTAGSVFGLRPVLEKERSGRLFAVYLWTEADSSVTVDGETRTADDQAAARRAAVRDALRKGVRKVFGVERQDLGLFIERYTLVAEREADGVLTVTVQAFISPTAPDCAPLSGKSVFIDAHGVTELAAKFAELVTELGGTVSPSRDQAQFGFDIQGDFSPRKHPAELIDGVRLALSVRLVNVATGMEICVVANDPKKATVFGGTPEYMCAAAVGKAFSSMKDALIDRLANIE